MVAVGPLTRPMRWARVRWLGLRGAKKRDGTGWCGSRREYEGLGCWGMGDMVKVGADIWMAGRGLEMVEVVGVLVVVS